MGDSVITFEHVSKRFRVGQTHDSIRDVLTAGVRRLFRAAPTRTEESFWALSDVSFRVGRGEVLGIIGPNGAGKSTALKLLAGILRPEHGSVCVTGRLAALIEVGAGFHGDLTGRENIFLNGTILGMSRAEIASKLDAIVEFAGLERFLDMPVKRYSSGMYARLGFSIAAHVEPEILLVDEVLSVGDAVFRLRCIERMKQLVSSGTTLVFVTHDLDQMQKVCTRTIVLDQGAVRFEGTPPQAVSRYLTAVSQSLSHRSTDEVGGLKDGAVELESLAFAQGESGETNCLRAAGAGTIQVALRVRCPIERLVVEVNIRRALGEAVVSLNSGRAGRVYKATCGAHCVDIAFSSLPLAGGQYYCNVRAWDAARGDTVLDTPFRYPLVINDEGKATGMLCVDHDWSFSSSPQSMPANHAVVPVIRTDLGACREDLPLC